MKVKKLFCSKKAAIEDMSFWIPRLLLILFVVSAIVFIVSSILSKNLDTGSLHQNLLASRVINSETCLAKSEKILETKKVYPGIVDLKKFDDSFLQKECIVDKNNLIGVSITLQDYGTKYINKDYYDEVEPLTFSERFIKVTKILPVIVEKDGKKETKILEIIVVSKKR